jgi:4-amino-4-deoxy-L-arabinose transferase-like glycosyltransferase
VSGEVSGTVSGTSLAWLFAAAVLSSAAALPLHFIGEEGILAISSLEMGYHSEWLRLRFYGSAVDHGMFANWLIAPVAAALGWDSVLAVSRGVMALSTAATGGVLFWLVRRLTRDAALAGLAAVLFVTFGDVLLYRGWLAYRDPLFGLLVFLSIAALWVGVEARRARWLAVTAAAAFCAFLTKGPTAYVLLACAVLVLGWDREQRVFLLRPGPLALAALALALPVLWLEFAQGGIARGGQMSGEIAGKFAFAGAGAWLAKLVAYPLETFARLAPASVLAAWCLHRQAARAKAIAAEPLVRTAAAIGLLGFLPFWLAPHSHVRYLLPLMPLAAIVCAVVIQRSGEERMRTATRWLWAAVGLKLVFLLGFYPYYQAQYRGQNYEDAARDIQRRAGGEPLYSSNVTASGLSVTAHLDLLRLPQPPLTFPPREWASGFVVSHAPDAAAGRVAAEYRLGGTPLYLLCRGAACKNGETP